ncbi:mutanobactin A biosynthesis transacylase MubG [Streptococcus mutans]|uniref:mutanobactin A biosynthesis transacylase MubG n=1 Tax=Streptococcus mutans TaxID=1309 RepID=UPI0009AF8D83|nr:mutanobactin A biosynthesis transacylase MubG [Streptococcus mutans]
MEQIMRLVALFSGQGVKKLDFSSFFLSEKNLKEIIDKGSSVLGINLRTEIISEEPKTILNDPYLSQIAVFLYSLLEFKDVERRKDIDPIYFAGQSLGELTALVCSRKVDVETGFYLVKNRAKFMQECIAKNEGSMYSLKNVPISRIERYIKEIKLEQNIFISNINSSKQVIVSGEKHCVEEFISYLASKNVYYMKLNTLGAFHTKLMAPAAKKLFNLLGEINFVHNDKVLFSNVTGSIYDKSNYRELLSRQICEPVQWQKIIENLQSYGLSNFIEIGGNRIIANLLKESRMSFNKLIPENIDPNDRLQASREVILSFCHFGINQMVINKNSNHLYDQEIIKIYKYLEQAKEKFSIEEEIAFLIELDEIYNEVKKALVLKEVSNTQLERFDECYYTFKNEINHYLR